MRVELKGFKCDICGERIPSIYDCVKISAIIHEKGEHNNKVSSDITTKSIGVNHLCKDCYFSKLERRLF